MKEDNLAEVNLTRITRFTYINQDGHTVEDYNIALEVSVKDNGRTLKIYARKRDENLRSAAEE